MFLATIHMWLDDKNTLSEKKLEQKTSFWEGVLNVVDSLFGVKLGVELKALQESILWGKNASTSNSKQHVEAVSNTQAPTYEATSWFHDIDVHKKMSEYTPKQSRGLFEKIFGAWVATQFLCYKTNNSPVAMQRVMALASHEGGFHFGIRNADPTKTGPNGWQLNRGTFQISGKDPEKKEAEAVAWLKKLTAGTPFAWINIDILDTRQRELALWIWYINTRKNPTQIFADLADPNLSDAQVVTLMSTRIQWGIPVIGQDVVKKTKNATAGQYFAQMSKHGYEPIA